MKIEEKFNKRSADLVKVVPVFFSGPQYAEGIKIEFSPSGNELFDPRVLRLHLTPEEALDMAEQLIASARRAQQG
jgi:hypothetical protein